MKQPRKSKTVAGNSRSSDPIGAYSRAQPTALRTTCDRLRKLIDAALPKTTSRIWHGSPVWFSDENPVVGYSATAKAISLLFWNGQSLDEPALKPVGKYRAAQVQFGGAAEIDSQVVRRWLKKAGANVFDSKSFFQKLRESSRNV